MARRSVNIPAGITLRGVTVPTATQAQTEYTSSESTSGMALRAVQRDALGDLRRKTGIADLTWKEVQAATKAINAPLGKARGGRLPDRVKVAGFRQKSGRAGAGAAAGITTFSRGSEKSGSLPSGFAKVDAMVRQAFARDPNARIQVSGFGHPPADDPRNQSPRRRKKDHPRGAWKKGDIIPRARQWGSTAQVSSLDQWERLYGTPERFTYGPTGTLDETGRHAGTGLDPARLSQVDVVVRKGGQ